MFGQPSRRLGCGLVQAAKGNDDFALWNLPHNAQ
jgi:hypothetical protein